MTDMFRKINYLIDKKTKIKLIILFFMIFGGAFAELLGITMILPIIELSMDLGAVLDNKIANIIYTITGIDDSKYLILIIIGCTIIIYIIKNIYMSILQRTLFMNAAIIKRNLAIKLMSAYMQQPYTFFLKTNSSELIRGITMDIGHFYSVITNILSLISNGITVVCIVIYLAFSNLYMTIIVSVLLLTCLLIIVFGLQKKNRENGRMIQKLSGIQGKHLRQSFEGIKDIKIANSEEYFMSAYSKNYKKTTDIEVIHSLYGTLPKYLIEVFIITAVLIYLGYNIQFNENYMNVIPTLAIFCYAAFKLLPSINAMYASINSIVYYKASVDLVYNDIKEVEELEGKLRKKEGVEKEIVFEKNIFIENVCFRYDGTEKNVLENVNIEIPKGKSVAFIGASGGGKTTMADIILSLLEPTSGKVCVDGQNISENVVGWRKKLGYIPQTIYLTDDTIRNNIAFGIERENIDDELVWKALEEAQLKDFVEQLPKKLDTEVGERGARISGGQRQRIGIARALYRNPEILVFDEATSALDNDTEKDVMEAIENLQGTKTMIIIAHRLTTIEKCDYIYKVENQRVQRIDKEVIL